MSAHSKYAVLAVVAAVLLAACGSSGSFVWASQLRPDEVGAGDYAIVAGDVVSVRVFGQDAMSTRAKVRSDGKISMPFLGDVLVLGKTPSAAAREMEAGLKNFINSPNVTFLYCAPHTFHMGGDIAGIMRHAGPLLTHLHVADSFDHRASSGLRYIVNPPGSPARIHQHLDIGQGEVNWEEFFGALDQLHFDGIMTVCVLAWEERAEQSSIFMREKIGSYVNTWAR